MIIGGQRSGTGPVAAALAALGLLLGKDASARYEPRIPLLHDQYLELTSSFWHGPGPLLTWLSTPPGHEDCRQALESAVQSGVTKLLGYRRWLDRLPAGRVKRGAPWGWRDPRTTLFAKVWLDVFPEARLLHVVRHPVDAALSLQSHELRRRESGYPPIQGLHSLDYCLDLAALYMEAGEAAAASAKHYHRIRFEDIQENPRTVITSLAAFCGLEADTSRFQAADRAIDLKGTGRWRALPRETTEELLSRYAVFTRLGYPVALT